MPLLVPQWGNFHKTLLSLVFGEKKVLFYKKTQRSRFLYFFKTLLILPDLFLQYMIVKHGFNHRNLNILHILLCIMSPFDCYICMTQYNEDNDP